MFKTVIGALMQGMIDLILYFAVPPKYWFAFSEGGSGGQVTMLQNIITGDTGGAAMWSYFSLFAIGLTTCYFIIDLNKKWMFEGASMSIKSMFVPFIKFVLAIVFLSQAHNLFGMLLGFSDTIITWAHGLDFTGANFKADGFGAQLASTTSFWSGLFLFVFGIVGIVVALIVMLVWLYKGLLYKVELVMRTLYAPIACADVYSGQNSAIIKYIKGYLGHILYGASIMIVPRITFMLAIGLLTGSSTMGSSPANTWDTVANGDILNAINMFGNDIIAYQLDFFPSLINAITIAIAPIAAIGLVATSKQIIHEALGG